MDDNVYLITGGSKGIGRELARSLIQKGAKVCICGRNSEKLTLAHSDLLGNENSLLSVQADVSQYQDCISVVEQVIKHFGKLDVLVNNAGMAMRGLFSDTKAQVMKDIIDINFLGAAYMTQVALPHIIATKGSIVFISTLAALHGLPRVSFYCASKGALTTFSQSLRSELSPFGVHVGIVYVGFTENDKDKVVYAPDGELIPLAQRKNSQTQQETALCIEQLIRKRASSTVLTGSGKVAALMYRLFPRFSNFLITRFASTSGQYAEKK